MCSLAQYEQERQHDNVEWTKNLLDQEDRQLAFYSQQALRQCQAELTKVNNKLQTLEMRRPSVLLLGFLGTLVWLCMTGAVMFFGWLEAVSHPMWVLLKRLGDSARARRQQQGSNVARDAAGSTPSMLSPMVTGELEEGD